MGHEKNRPDPILRAELKGAARRHAQYRDLTDAETAAAVDELRSITTRPDLLAQVAGTLIGYHDLERRLHDRNVPMEDVDAIRLEVAYHHRAAQLLIAAGADEDALPRWIEVGRKRAAAPGPGLRHAPSAGSERD